MKGFRKFIEEDGVAANCAGGGQIAGIGVGPQGEPGGILPADRKKRRLRSGWTKGVRSLRASQEIGFKAGRGG